MHAPLWTLLGGIVVYYLCATKRRFPLPQSARRLRRYRRLTRALQVCAAVVLAGIVLAMLSPDDGAMLYAAGASAILGLPALLVTIIWRGSFRPRLRFDGTTVTFRKVHPAFDAAVRQWLYVLSRPPAPPAGWYADPSRTYEHRYFDGRQWTEHVSSAGAAGIAPL